MALVKIDQATFTKVYQKTNSYIFLCYQGSSTANKESLLTIENICKRFPKKLQAYLVCDEDLIFFQRTYNFWGTPVYILLREGVEKERLMGKVTEETMTRFILRNINRD